MMDDFHKFNVERLPGNGRHYVPRSESRWQYDSFKNSIILIQILYP